MWHHGCTATVLMHDEVHIKLHYSPVSLLHGSVRGRVTHCCQSREGSITSCISMQSPGAAERVGSQSKTNPRAILEPLPGLGDHLAPQVLAPPPPVGSDGLHTLTCTSSTGSSCMYIKHNNSITPSPYGSPHTRSPTHHSLCTESLLPPTTTEYPPARPCPSPPALRQPCLFAQGICSRGHLL